MYHNKIEVISERLIKMSLSLVISKDFFDIHEDIEQTIHKELLNLQLEKSPKNEDSVFYFYPSKENIDNIYKYLNSKNFKSIFTSKFNDLYKKNIVINDENIVFTDLITDNQILRRIEFYIFLENDAFVIDKDIKQKITKEFRFVFKDEIYNKIFENIDDFRRVMRGDYIFYIEKKIIPVQNSERLNYAFEIILDNKIIKSEKLRELSFKNKKRYRVDVSKNQVKINGFIKG